MWLSGSHNHMPATAGLYYHYYDYFNNTFCLEWRWLKHHILIVFLGWFVWLVCHRVVILDTRTRRISSTQKHEYLHSWYEYKAWAIGFHFVFVFYFYLYFKLQRHCSNHFNSILFYSILLIALSVCEKCATDQRFQLKLFKVRTWLLTININKSPWVLVYVSFVGLLQTSLVCQNTYRLLLIATPRCLWIGNWFFSSEKRIVLLCLDQ